MDFDLELKSNIEALSIPSNLSLTIPDHTYYAHWMGLGNYHVISEIDENGHFLISHTP